MRRSLHPTHSHVKNDQKKLIRNSFQVNRWGDLLILVATPFKGLSWISSNQMKIISNICIFVLWPFLEGKWNKDKPKDKNMQIRWRAPGQYTPSLKGISYSMIRGVDCRQMEFHTQKRFIYYLVALSIFSCFANYRIICFFLVCIWHFWQTRLTEHINFSTKNKQEKGLFFSLWKEIKHEILQLTLTDGFFPQKRPKNFDLKRDVSEFICNFICCFFSSYLPFLGLIRLGLFATNLHPTNTCYKCVFLLTSK